MELEVEDTLLRQLRLSLDFAEWEETHKSATYERRKSREVAEPAWNNNFVAEAARMTFLRTPLW